jgi:uncharacterized membrane protein
MGSFYLYGRGDFLLGGVIGLLVVVVVVVVKLFVVDLSGSGTVSRIVSFLAVGGLMLVIGFFTPLPLVVSKGESR